LRGANTSFGKGIGAPVTAVLFEGHPPSPNGCYHGRIGRISGSFAIFVKRFVAGEERV
jgi:hypothetical protein